MSGVNKKYLREHKLFRIRNKNIIVVFPLIALLVVLTVFWCLKLVGITVTSDALCEVEPHTHSSECYNGEELICNKPEHIHTSDCFPDKTVDTETANDWTKTFNHIAISNNVPENLVAIASTQVGYSESDRNYEFNSHAEMTNYSRYGEWYGNPYGEWNTIFVSFCMNYANAKDAKAFSNASAESMRIVWRDKNLYSSVISYTPSRGDIVFFDTNSDGKADRTGIVIHKSDNLLMTIEGDVEGTVRKIDYQKNDNIMGYGKTGELGYAEKLSPVDKQQSSSNTQNTANLSGNVNRYIPLATAQPAMFRMTRADKQQSSSNTQNTANLLGNVNRCIPLATVQPAMFRMTRAVTVQEASTQVRSVYDSEPLEVMPAAEDDITYHSELSHELVEAVFKELSGNELSDGDTVYIGESYIVSLEFREINTGDRWYQFKHNEDGYLTYQIPENIHCEAFDDWHTISAKTENGTVQDVGEYFVDETGLLRVRFLEDDKGVNFVDKYANVDFSIDFTATVASTLSGTDTEIKFNDDITINLNVDGDASMTVTKTHGEYDSENNTLDYTIRVEATHGLVRDLIIDDQIWDSHYTLRDTILVTDLEGNVLDPQPIVTDHPSHNSGAEEGFRISGFPDFSAGHGFLITYKTSIYDNLLSSETVDMWNGLDSTGKNSKGQDVYVWSDDWLRVELEKMEKEGKQTVIEDDNGNDVSVIEWEIGIRKNTTNMQGTVVIDTLGDGLSYYTGEPIRIKRYDVWGNRIADVYLDWNNVTINGNTMTFDLPDGYAFDIVYYTSFEKPNEDETKNYSNSVKATINGKEEQTTGSANVVGFTPKVWKSASGDDGEYVNFQVQADVAGIIEDWGYFYFTDLMAFWGYPDNDEGYLYVENIPEDLVVTATTESGQTITFSPYKEGGPTENTYILVVPAEGKLHHSFNIYFNTTDPEKSTSKWILNENAVLTISYKIPFTAKTGVEWEGEMTGDLTLGDVLLDGNKLANEGYLNYTEVITGVGSTTYEYSPKITKKSVVHESGVIDYTVEFNNTIPGSGGNDGYVDGTVDVAWFNDTFDEKMEYVPGSLVVTGYSPWQKDVWLAKYVYNGAVTGNSFSVSSRDLVFLDYNEAADAYGWNGISGTANFRNYYRWVNAGGRFVFTYSLKIKDEYLKTVDHSKFHLDNTAELTWDPNGTSGPVTETSEYETGLLDKVVVQTDTRLDFKIHVNRSALDILPGADTLTIEDVMTANLSVYWHSISLLYEESEGVWVDFSSPESKYKYKILYDPVQNKLTFIIPDSLHVAIDYNALITESGLVSVQNSVVVDGKAQVSDLVDAVFKVESHIGDASGSNNSIVLMKEDGITLSRLPNASFMLYGKKGDSSAVRPAGVPQTIVAEDGSILKFIGYYTTGADGTVDIESQYLTEGGPYALVEHVAPEGYELLDKPTYFNFFKDDPNGAIQNVTTLVVVQNYTGTFVLPETGGFGTSFLATIGFVITATPILYSLIRRKRERSFIIS